MVGLYLRGVKPQNTVPTDFMVLNFWGNDLCLGTLNGGRDRDHLGQIRVQGA